MRPSKTYVDGYGVTREEYVSPIAQALRKAEKLLNEPKTITLEDGTESHIITGEPPAVSLAFSPLMLIRKARLGKQIKDAQTAVNNAKSTTKWWNNPELRTIFRNWNTKELQEANKRYSDLSNIHEYTFGEKGLSNAKQEFESIKQVKANGMKVGEALRRNPFGPAGINDLKNAESPYLRQVSSVASEAYAKAK